MPDLETLATVLDIIRYVPDAHNQGSYLSRLSEGDKSRIREELEGHPELAEVVHCDTAACVGGWALLVKGYGLRDGRFTYPPGHVLPDGTPVGGQHLQQGPGREAATVLGLKYEEAMSHGRGLFVASNTLADIEDWIAYYRGELDQQQLYTRLQDRASG